MAITQDTALPNCLHLSFLGGSLELVILLGAFSIGIFLQIDGIETGLKF